MMTCLKDLVDGDDRPPTDAADAAEVFLFRDLGDEVTLGGAIHIIAQCAFWVLCLPSNRTS